MARLSSLRSTLTPALIASIAVFGGLAIRDLKEFSPAVWLAAGPALAVAGYVLSRSPRLCVAALLLVDILGLYQGSLSVGPIGLRSIDVIWFALIVWTIVERQANGVVRAGDIGQRQLVLFLAALGTSLLPLLVGASGSKVDSVVAWLRLIQTFSVIWLLPYAARRVNDAEFLMGAVGACAAIETARAVILGSLRNEYSIRLQGGNGPNTTGLIAAVLIVCAIHAPLPRSRALRVGMIVLGLLGLAGARSLGATVALAGALALFGLRPVSSSRSPRTALFTPTRVIVLVLVALAFAMTFRSENLPVSDEFRRSTTVHRVILAQAGIELFLTHPVVGVGWQQSPDAVQSKELNEQLRSQFQDVNPEFLPDRNPTGVHNAYVQVVTEAGLIGLLGFLVFAIACIRGIRSLLRKLKDDPRRYACARSAVVVLVVVAIWFNDNALYGAQPETLLVATMLGLLAALGAVPQQPAATHPLSLASPQPVEDPS